MFPSLKRCYVVNMPHKHLFHLPNNENWLWPVECRQSLCNEVKSGMQQAASSLYTWPLAKNTPILSHLETRVAPKEHYQMQRCLRNPQAMTA